MKLEYLKTNLGVSLSIKTVELTIWIAATFISGHSHMQANCVAGSTVSVHAKLRRAEKEKC